MADSTGLAFDTLTRTADTVVVTARVWPEYQITGSPVEIVGLIGEMTHYPTHWRTPTSTSTLVGQFEWVHLHMFAAFESANSRTTVPWGPNEGLSYFPSPPPLGQDMQTWTHPALFPPGSVRTGNFLDWTWYLQQDGSKFLWPLLSPTDSGNYVTACDSAGVSRLRMQSRGHEGLQNVFSANSHFAILRNGISSKPVAMWLERVVLSDSTSTLPLNTLVYDSIYNPIFVADTLFEQPEYARIFGANKVYGVRQTDSGAIGCYINTPNFRPPTP